PTPSDTCLDFEFPHHSIVSNATVNTKSRCISNLVLEFLATAQAGVRLEILTFQFIYRISTLLSLGSRSWEPMRQTEKTILNLYRREKPAYSTLCCDSHAGLTGLLQTCLASHLLGEDY